MKISPKINEDFDRFRLSFRRECIEGSAIAPDLYDAAVDFIEDTGFWEPNRALGQEVARFWQTRKPHNYGAIACFRQHTGEIWQAKPQNPRTEKDQKILKYETPVGAGSRAFFPAMPGQPEYWKAHRENPKSLLIITEGAKKALALLSQGYVAIALTGVNGGYRSNEKIDGEAIPLAAPELIGDLIPYCVPGRPVVLAFDQDTKEATRRRVAAALWKFGGLLAAAGCEVAIAEWSPAYKGIDDLIAGAGAEAAHRAIAEAIPLEEWRSLQRLRQRIKRRPDINIGDAEFSSVALPSTGLVALSGGKGSGKSKAIGRALAESGDRWLSITSLISLARQQAAAWGGVFLNDSDRYGSQLLKGGRAVPGGSVCIPSLLAAQQIEDDTLIIDEASEVMEFLQSSPLANRDGLRPLLIGELGRRIRQARRVVLADADLEEETIRYFERLRGDGQAFLIRSDRKPLQWQANCYGKKNELLAGFLAAVEQAPKDKLVLFLSDSKGTAEMLARVLSDRRIKSLVITQETSGGKDERSFLESQGRDLPALIRSGVRAILCSPSVRQGLSLQEKIECIDSIWAAYQGGSIDADGISQQLDRVRSDLPRNIYIPKKGSAYSRYSRATSAREWLREFKALSTKNAQLVRHSLKPSSAIAVDGIDWESENLKLLAHYESEKNRQMMALRAEVYARLRHEGKTIVQIASNSSAQAKKIAKEIAAASGAAKQERWMAIALAPLITEEEARKLEAEMQRRALDVSEMRSLEAFYQRQFYRLQELRYEDVAFDNDERTRKAIRRLEELLIDGVAASRSASSIDRNPTTPQDWNSAELRRWLLLETGAGQFIRAIWAGEIEVLDSERVKAIASIIQQHSHQFKVAFGFTVDKMSPQQVVGEILGWFGIKTKAKRIRKDDKLYRSYSIDTAHLGKLKACLQRRNQAAPPPLEKDQFGGGGTQIAPAPSARQTLIEMLSVAVTEEEREEIKAALAALEAAEAHSPPAA